MKNTDFVARQLTRAQTVLCVRRSGCYDVFTAKEPIFSFREIDGFLRKTKKRKFGSTICTANDADAVFSVNMPERPLLEVLYRRLKHLHVEDSFYVLIESLSYTLGVSHFTEYTAVGTLRIMPYLSLNFFIEV